MSNEATPDPKTAAIVADLELPNPATNKAIALKHGVHPSTVGRIAERFAVQIRLTKKGSVPPATGAATMPEGFRAKAVSVTNAALDLLTDDKLKKCSAPQLAVIAGILRDKVRDIDKAGEESSTLTIRFGSRRDALAFLRGEGPPPPGLPVIEAEAVPAAIPAAAAIPPEPAAPI